MVWGKLSYFDAGSFRDFAGVSGRLTYLDHNHMVCKIHPDCRDVKMCKIVFSYQKVVLILIHCNSPFMTRLTA